VSGKPFFKLVSELKLEEEDYEKIVDEVLKFLKPKENRIIERNTFFNLKKEDEESLGEYLSKLKKQAEKCNFEDNSKDTITNLLIRDQFIRGLKSFKIVESIFSEKDESLEATFNRAQALSQATKDTDTIIAAQRSVFATERFDKMPTNLRKFPTPKRVAIKTPQYYKKFNFNPKDINCFSCGKKGHVSKDCYKNKKCPVCQRFGHTANYCRRNKINFILNTDNTKRMLTQKICINGFPADFLVDTGSFHSFINMGVAKNLGLKLLPGTLMITLADNSQIKLTSFVRVQMAIEDKTIQQDLWCLKTSFEGILGLNIINKVGLSIGNNGTLLFSTSPHVVEKFKHIFDKD